MANGYNYDGTTSGNKIAKALTSINSWKSKSTVEGAPGSSDYPEKQNSSGFSALPGGSRQESFIGEGYVGLWLSSQGASCAGMTGNLCDFMIGSSLNNYGLSVRCIKEEEPVANVQGSFTDGRDGKTYKTVTIGTQTWMAENLAYLPTVSDPNEVSYTVPFNYVYGYNGNNIIDAKVTANYKTYGALYNWPAAVEACPAGWHLPSDDEWAQLANYLGGSSVAGGKMKSVTGWDSPNTDATNSSGFTAFPGGAHFYGTFVSMGSSGVWWSSTEYNSVDAWNFYLAYGFSTLSSSHPYKHHGSSVRCIKD
jgi:uncharacterized protein (TIGR02145 family)